MGFVFLSFVLFFFARTLGGLIYQANSSSDGIGYQIAEKINFSLKFIGVYILILITLSLIGTLLSRKKNKEIYLGFLYSMLFCLFVGLFYICTVVYLYI